LAEELDARRAEAETTMLELREDTSVVWEERRELLIEIRQFADQAKALPTESVTRHPDAALSRVRRETRPRTRHADEPGG